MKTKGENSKTVDAYIQSAPERAQKHLKELRSILKGVVPEAIETVKWGSPIFEEKRILFAYTAHKEHINFMPTRRTLVYFTKELEPYTTGTDTVQFPYDKPLPKNLIIKLAKHRTNDVRQNDSRWME